MLQYYLVLLLSPKFAEKRVMEMEGLNKMKSFKNENTILNKLKSLPLDSMTDEEIMNRVSQIKSEFNAT